MILVVGATGQVGSLVVRRLRADGAAVRAMVRDPASAGDLAATGAELVFGDLRHPETLDAALEGVTAVVATANATAPVRRGDTAAAVENGYAELVRRAEHAGVSRFVLASTPETDLDETVPVARTKRRTEELLAASGLSWLSLRMPPFSEVWLALVGSELPLRGEERTTLGRAYPTLRRFRRVTGRTLDRHGLMLVPGPASSRQRSCRCTTPPRDSRRPSGPRRGPGRSTSVAPRRCRGPTSPASLSGCSTGACGSSASPPRPTPSSCGC